MNLLVRIYLNKDIEKVVINKIKIILNSIEIKRISFIKNFEGTAEFIKFPLYKIK
jgi:hypothetical protein